MARGAKLGGRRPGQGKVDPALGSAARTRKSNEFAATVGPVATELRDGGMSLRQIVAELDKRNIRTMRGGQWTATTVRNSPCGSFEQSVRIRATHFPLSNAAVTPKSR